MISPVDTKRWFDDLKSNWKKECPSCEKMLSFVGRPSYRTFMDMPFLRYFVRVVSCALTPAYAWLSSGWGAKRVQHLLYGGVRSSKPAGAGALE